MNQPASQTRLELLAKATEQAGAEFIQSMRHIEEGEGEVSAAVEMAVYFSWINNYIDADKDSRWFNQHLAAIEYRGGPRTEVDEAILKLRDLTPTQRAALSTLGRHKQLQVAQGFFYIHSGAANVEFAPIPNLRFTIHHGLHDADFQPVTNTEFPNWLGEMFNVYVNSK